MKDQQNTSDSKPAHVTDPRLLTVLVCPITKANLIYDRQAGRLISLQAKCAYLITDDVPIMLKDAAQSLSDDELSLWQKKNNPV